MACPLHWLAAMRAGRLLVVLFLLLSSDALAGGRPARLRPRPASAPRRLHGASFQRALPRLRRGTRAAIHLAVLQRRTDRSIRSVETSLGKLVTRIATLESQNASKEQQARELVSAIDRRRAQLREHRNAKGFFSVIGLLGSIATGGMGAPLFIGGMALAARDGVRVADLEARLRTLHGERAALTRLIESHGDLKRGLEGDLGRLRAAEAAIAGALASLEADSTAPRGRTLDGARRRLGHSRDLFDNLRAQSGILVRIEKSAGAVGVAVDLHLAAARRDLAQAEKMVAESTRDYIDLVAVAMSPSPAAAAGGLIDRLLVDRGAALLRDAGLGKEAANLLARAVVRRVGAGAGAEAALAASLESRL